MAMGVNGTERFEGVRERREQETMGRWMIFSSMSCSYKDSIWLSVWRSRVSLRRTRLARDITQAGI